MPLVLSQRNTEISEKMDDPFCDVHTLNNTYEQFKTINKLLSGWTGIYTQWIRPVIASQNGKATLLDIGSGGGDIIRLLSNLARRDGFDVMFTGVDPDARATNFARKKFRDKNIRFLKETSAGMVKKQERFDVVISNHLVHHLSYSELGQTCSEASDLANRLVLFNDIQRSDTGYASFRLFAPLLFSNSFIVEDGLTSIKRSYTKNELQQHLPEGWQVHRKFPFRLIAIHQKS